MTSYPTTAPETVSGSHTLIRHHDIQEWVNGHRGLPAIAKVRNRFGEVRAKLAIRFARQRAAAQSSGPRADDGLSPVSWTAWLAELDRQGLALKVTDKDQFEFVSRH